MQQGGVRLSPAPGEGIEGVNKRLSASISSKRFTAKHAIASYAQSCLVKLGFHKFPD